MAKFKVGDVVTWYEDLVPHKGAIVRRVLGGDVEIMWRGKTLVVEDNDLSASAARNAKFKVGDRVENDGNYGFKAGVRGTVEKVIVDGWNAGYLVKLDDGRRVTWNDAEIVSANAARNAVIEKKLPPRGAGVYIEQQGGSFAVGPTDDGWSVANYGGEGVDFAHGFKTVSEAKSWCASKGYKVEDVILANAVVSRNAVVQKALNAVARNGAMAALDSSEKSKIKSIASGMPCSFMDGGDSLSGVIKHSKRPFLYIDFDVSKSEIDGKPYYEWYVHAWNRTRKWERNGGQYKIEDAVSAAAQAMRGAKQMIEKWSGGVPLNAQTSVLRETAVNGTRTTNAVVAKALNAQAVCNETIEGVFKGLDSGKYDSVAVAPRGNGFPEVRRYGGGVGFSYGDEDELRAMIKSGKYVELLYYKNHSLKGRIPLNASRVARNGLRISEIKSFSGSSGLKGRIFYKDDNRTVEYEVPGLGKYTAIKIQDGVFKVYYQPLSSDYRGWMKTVRSAEEAKAAMGLS